MISTLVDTFRFVLGARDFVQEGYEKVHYCF
jgi:hypothetical protein